MSPDDVGVLLESDKSRFTVHACIQNETRLVAET